MKRLGFAVTLVSLVAGSALAEPADRFVRVPMQFDEATTALGNAPVVNSNKVYLNNCKPNGCVVMPGSSSSLDGSGFQGRFSIGSTKTLKPFNQSDAVWNDTVSCLKDIFGPYGIEFTTTNPSPNPHFEIMIAGKSTDIGLDANTLGISGFACQMQYIPNALVFAFANSSLYVNQAESICETAAQELAHSFNLDHVTEPSDPLTYFQYSGRQRFKNAQVQCGSDCVGGMGPFGQTCTGSTKQIHNCTCTNQPTQNSHMTLSGFFGNGTPTPPKVKFVDLELGKAVSQGFPIRVEASDENGVANVQAFVDGMSAGILATGPFAFNAPASLANGTHTVRAVATDIYGTSAEALVQVVIGEKCEEASDCPLGTDACIGGRCVPGPGADRGLGVTCTTGNDCASGQCAQDSTGAKHCVEPCTLEAGECPSGFGCLDAGGAGICWPGAEEGGGGGGCQSGQPAAPIGMGLAFGALLLVRRKRRA